MFKTFPQRIESSDIRSDLRDSTIHDIVKQFYAKSKSFKNVHMDGFKDGKIVRLTDDDRKIIQNSGLNELSQLGKSIRLTNVQLIAPEIARVCEKLYNQEGKVFTVNLYFTPNSEAQCFVMHSDPQETLVYQLHGQKQWTFVQLTDGSFLTEKFEENFVLKEYQRGSLKGSDYILDLKEGDVLSFDYCLHHRATNLVNSPSVHLTFAANRPSLGELVQFIGSRILNEDILNKHFEPVSLDEILKKLDGNKFSASEFIEEYMKDFLHQENEKKIHGRRYS